MAKKAQLRELTADLKAAVVIGQQEAVSVALDGLRQLPDIAGNHPIGEAFLEQAILPLGHILSGGRIPASRLVDYLRDPLTGIRAVASAALGLRFCSQGDVQEGDLRRAGSDTREEVRVALAKALIEGTPFSPEQVLLLGSAWARPHKGGASWPVVELRLCTTALAFLTAFAQSQPEALLVVCLLLHRDGELQVRAGVADLLLALAESGHSRAVLERLSGWAQEQQPNEWLICRALSGSWASRELEMAEEILKSLEKQVGTSSQVSNARKALERHAREQ